MANQPSHADWAYSSSHHQPRLGSERPPYQDYLPKHEPAAEEYPPRQAAAYSPWHDSHPNSPASGSAYYHSAYSHQPSPAEYAHPSRYSLAGEVPASALSGPRPNSFAQPPPRLTQSNSDGRLTFGRLAHPDEETPSKFRRESLVSGAAAGGALPTMSSTLSRSNSQQQQYSNPTQTHRTGHPHQPQQPYYYHSEPATPALDFAQQQPSSAQASSQAYFFSQTNQSPYTPAHLYSHTGQPVHYGYGHSNFGPVRSDSGSVEYSPAEGPPPSSAYVSHLDNHSHHSHSSAYPYPGSSIPPAIAIASGSSAGSLSRPPTRSGSVTDLAAQSVVSQPGSAYHSPLIPSAHISQHNSPITRHQLSTQAQLPPLASIVSPLIPPPAIPHVKAASTARRAFRSRPPPLTFNPAREPSASARLSKTLTSQGLVVPAQGAKGKAVLEIVGSCWTCGEPSCKVILRGHDLGFSPRLSFTCLACLPTVDPAGSSDDGEEGEKRADGSIVKKKGAKEYEPVYSDTLSAAVDVIEGVELRQAEEEPPEATSAKLPESLKPQGMKCDVCDRIVGCGTIAPADPSSGPAPPFTSEVICSRCSEKYKACSDCGGGGGRLTPGRWRCKELFPQGRRTCQLSHARNPPLNEITYHVIPITSLDHQSREDLVASCRQLYFNTRLRVTARPEMLERGDGLCRTFAEAEKLTIDGWGLLQPLMEHDIEHDRHIRRYVAVQYSIPHRRRAKNKSEPPPEEVLERTVSGFMLVEYEFETGAIYFAVVMPWALSGDAFDATTKLGEEVFARCRADNLELNETRASQGLPAYPGLSWNWGITPFKKESRMTQSLTRRGYQFLDEMKANGEMPEADLRCFPEGGRTIHVPEQFVKAFHVFVRPVEASLRGSSQASAPGGKKIRQRVRKRKISG